MHTFYCYLDYFMLIYTSKTQLSIKYSVIVLSQSKLSNNKKLHALFSLINLSKNIYFESFHIHTFIGILNECKDLCYKGFMYLLLLTHSSILLAIC